MIAAITADAAGRLIAKTAMVEWLVEKVTQSRTERAGQDERRPEKSDPRRICPIIQSSYDRQPGDEHRGTALVSETARVSDPVTEGGSQRLRKSDGRPVERFHAWRAHGVDRDCALRPVPKREQEHEAREQE